MPVEINVKQYASDVIARFKNKVEMTENCWFWRGAHRGDIGACQFQIEQGVTVSARKFAHWLWVGPIPDGSIVRPICGTKNCVHPEHLRLSHGRPPIELNDMDIQRFWKFVDKSAGPDACWPWTGSKVALSSTNPKLSYGHFSLAGSTVKAHRVAWAIANNVQTPRDLHVRHAVCDNPICCNPAHLAIGTAKQNGQDKVSAGRSNNTPRGERNTNAKLTEALVRQIRAKREAEDVTLEDLADEFNLAISTVGKVCARQLWSHVI